MMKSRINKIVRWVLLVVCIVIPTFAITVLAGSTEPSAKSGNTVKAQVYSGSQAKTYVNAAENTARIPILTDENATEYVFAGWYLEEEFTTPIKSADDITSDSANVYAKFVPKTVLGVKAQVIATLCDDVVDASDTSTGFRFVTSLDTLNYSGAGLEVTYTNSSGQEVTKTNSNQTTVYKKLCVVGSDEDVLADEDGKEVVPSDVFSNMSQYFKAYTITGVPSAKYTTEFSVKPYWTTLDGTKVYGDIVIKKVEDGCIRQNAWVDVVNGLDVCYYGSQNAPYKTLEYAMTKANKAQKDATITLASNVDVPENLSINNTNGKTITIDGGSSKYTMTTGSYGHAFCIDGANGTVNFKNTTLKAKNWSSLVRVNVGATVNFTDVTIDATEPIKTDSTDNGYLYALINTLNGADTVTNLNFTRTNVTMKDGARSDSNKGIVRSGNGDVNKTVNISLDGCTWDTKEATGRSGIVIMGETTSKITLTNSTIMTKDALPIKDWTNSATIEKNNYNVSVDDTNVVASVGANSYSSLSAAVSNANGYAHNITIEVLNNSTTNAQCAIRNDDKVMYTIDGNGKTITAQDGGNFLRIEDIAKCDVTIKDFVINFKNTGAAIQVADNTQADIEVNVTDVDINADYTGMGTTTCNYALINLAAPNRITTLNMTRVNVDMITSQAGAEQTTAGIIRTGNADAAKTVNINLVGCDLDATGATKRQGIIIMNTTTSVVSMEDTSVKVTDGMSAIYRQKDDNTTDEMIEATRVILKGSRTLEAGTKTGLDAITNIDSSMIQEDPVYTNRIVLVSDIHYTAQNPNASENASGASGSILGYTQTERINILAQDIKNLMATKSVDGILVLGDLSTDDNGYRNLSQSYVQAFKNDCMSQITTVQWYTLAGNHDGYTSTEWNNIFGYERQYSFSIGDAAFIMLDTYKEGAISSASGANYEGVDFTWLNEEIANYSGKKIFLCAHYVNATDMQTIRSMTATNDQLVAVFDAHTHLNHATSLGTGMNEFHVNIGDYAYKTVEVSEGVYDFNQFDEAYAWGYQVLEWNDTEAHVYHVKPARTYTGTNGTFNYAGAIEGDRVIKYK